MATLATIARESLESAFLDKTSFVLLRLRQAWKMETVEKQKKWKTYFVIQIFEKRAFSSTLTEAH